MNSANIQKLLPEVMQRTLHEGSVLQALVEVMAQLQQPTEHLLDDLHCLINPTQAPEYLLPMLAHWMNLTRLFQPNKVGVSPAMWENRTLPTEPDCLRALIAASVRLSKWRGTRYGMLQMLSIATGLPDFQIADGTESGATSDETMEPFHMRVTVPPHAAPYRELIERIVEQEKPAYITAEIIYSEEAKPATQ